MGLLYGAFLIISFWSGMVIGMWYTKVVYESFDSLGEQLDSLVANGLAVSSSAGWAT